ncbi:MAG: SRPBCC family protein [Actinobacteria bacterium]|nr:SRPBCC family protein [Actinomycetota bacterium]
MSLGPNTLALREVQPLRDLQRINAAFSASTGIVMAATSSWLSRQVDLPPPVVAVLGVGLVGWSVLLVVLAVQPSRWLNPFSALVAAGDAIWVIGSAALITKMDPTAVGTFLVAAAAAVVTVFAVAGLLLGRHARAHIGHDRTEILFGSVTVDAPPSDAWQLVLDAHLYAQLAPNLTHINVADDECSRACNDTRGNTWTEAMHLDHERHVQQIDVDVTGHPMPLDELAATIGVHDDPNGSRIDIVFTYVTRASFKGLVTSLVLPVLGRRLLRPITRGWARHTTSQVATTGGAGGRS